MSRSKFFALVAVAIMLATLVVFAGTALAAEQTFVQCVGCGGGPPHHHKHHHHHHNDS